MMPTDTPTLRKGAWKAIIPILVILVVVIGVLFGIKTRLPEHQPPAGEIQEGAQVSDIMLTQFQGDLTKLSSIPGKVILVNFWATWCEACIVEIPSILKLRQEYKDKGLSVVFVNMDEDPDSVLPEALKKLRIDFPVYLDPKEELAEKFSVHAIPLTVILDKDRKVLLIESGERNWNGTEVHQLMDHWIAG